jgi:hypothetical protein
MTPSGGEYSASPSAAGSYSARLVVGTRCSADDARIERFPTGTREQLGTQPLERWAPTSRTLSHGAGASRDPPTAPPPSARRSTASPAAPRRGRAAAFIDRRSANLCAPDRSGPYTFSHSSIPRTVPRMRSLCSAGCMQGLPFSAVARAAAGWSVPPQTQCCDLTAALQVSCTAILLIKSALCAPGALSAADTAEQPASPPRLRSRKKRGAWAPLRASESRGAHPLSLPT